MTIEWRAIARDWDVQSWNGWCWEFRAKYICRTFENMCLSLACQPRRDDDLEPRLKWRAVPTR